MNYNYSSAILVDLNGWGLPIPEDSSLAKSKPVAFTFKDLPEDIFHSTPNLRITRLEKEDIAQDQVWKLKVQSTDGIGIIERNWDEVIEEVLHDRAQTWMELAEL